jgi:hypothetical protein
MNDIQIHDEMPGRRRPPGEWGKIAEILRTGKVVSIPKAPSVVTNIHVSLGRQGLKVRTRTDKATNRIFIAMAREIEEVVT